MKRRIRAFLLAVVMLFTTVAALLGDVTVAKADELLLKLHYEREDGNYDNWSVWFWYEGADGTDNPFKEENGEMVATLSVAPGTSSVGFIVRTPEWGKDIDKDQFIDIAECISGTVHIYVKSGVEGYTKEYGEDMVKGIKLSSASYKDKKVTVKMTEALEDTTNAFTVQNADGEDVAIAAITGEGPEYTLEMAEEFDLSKKYTITFDGGAYEIVMPDYYATEEFEAAYTYTGNDLGATWSKESTTFRVWAPTAEKVRVNLFKGGAAVVRDIIDQVDMTPDVNGTWVATVDGDLNGTFYTYEVTIDGEKTEASDPYARTTGVNGERAMVIDLDSTDPEGWENDKNPNADIKFNDAVIYELHIRDLGTDENSGITNVGKYLSLTEHGTKTPNGVTTGIDHIKELGITHLHILPMYDYGSVNESVGGDQFNWGYDPVNYNVPEGSYSTNAFDGSVRVNEVKQMVQSLHNDGISVVMDVVYNHVQSAGNFSFNKIVPNYFSRVSEAGAYSNGSGCGNDTASERAMVKKFIVDSVLYWVEEYHIDGFRFDLVGLIDTETINEVMETVHAVRPDVVFYGEGWTMNTTMTKEGYTLTTQTNSQEVPGFAFFNDNLRDGLKGNIFNNEEAGFVSGALAYESTIEDSFLGAASWCKSPTQTINYASCHDNMTLFDRLQNSRKDASQEDLIRMNNLSAAIYMTAQGIPFVHAGEEMLRTKVKEDGTFDHNSYSSPDSVNSLKWATLEDETYMNVVDYYKGLIAFRKAHPVLRLTTAEAVNEHVTVVPGMDKNVTAFSISGTGVEGEDASAMFVVFNANPESKEITLPEGNWNVYINGEKAGTEKLDTVSGTVTVDAISAVVLVQDNSLNMTGLLLIIVAALGVVFVAGLVANKKKKA